MPFPRTDNELVEQGYQFENKAKCRVCGADIEFYLTPRGKHIPLDAGTLEPHWSTCPNASEFRKKAPAPDAHAPYPKKTWRQRHPPGGW